jgi:hypothetical protein
MPDSETEATPEAASVIDAAILDAINQTQLATMAPQVLLASGAGRAYQAVAASAAIAVQDATDMLRNISTASTTAIGVALAQMLEGDADARDTLAAAQTALDGAVQHYAAICEAASKALKGFPTS